MTVRLHAVVGMPFTPEQLAANERDWQEHPARNWAFMGVILTVMLAVVLVGVIAAIKDTLRFKRFLCRLFGHPYKTLGGIPDYRPDEAYIDIQGRLHPASNTKCSRCGKKPTLWERI